MKISYQLVIIALGIGLLGTSCKHNDAFPEENTCVKGKYLFSYCHGVIIGLDGNTSLKGQTLRNPFTNQEFDNAVSASIDYENLAGVMDSLRAIPVGTEFYFRYKEGGIPRKEFMNCEYESTITFTYLSSQSCPPNEK